ncbi:Nuclear pore protein-like protein [Colletotrichum higginsianum IMI 349063]|uniref:Nuclear pore protein-like protein n=1 Tax=Colletotrichum higginsianum (strain IMI 349063) TaxID=759273 RepID=A0A1B7YED8_COLHI|nr:Nuclear pore protein-like protein [Colletotrichum higginsianum IMI 349063]OBR10433.1 Nuclear pore protein-like protein [Colletotrichum higginsianum IMI 349063]
MADEFFHKIDPDGDVLLILRNPNAPFAVWNGDERIEWFPPEQTRGGKQAVSDLADPLPPADVSDEWCFSTTSPSTEKKCKTKKEKKKGKKKNKKRYTFDDHDSSLCIGIASGSTLSGMYQRNTVSSSSSSSSSGSTSMDALSWSQNESQELAKDEPPAPAPMDPPAEPAEAPKIKYLVSSRHLILASSYFQAKFKGPWMEASTKHADGRYHVEASDWDSDALLTLMQVIHGRHRVVPHQVTLEMLAKIAVHVDYYDCLEVTEIFSSMWIESLQDKLPIQYGRDMILWLLISHVFQQDDIFSQMTKIAVTQSKEPVPTLELPIPSIVIDLIEWQRQDAIEFTLTTLRNLLETFRKGSSGCTFECSSMLLGALAKNMDEHKLLDPVPKEPYTGYSIVDMEKLKRSLRTKAVEDGN